MRELARGRYTAAQVLAQLTAQSYVHECRFDVVDRRYNVAMDPLDVVSASVDWDGSRPIARSLSMEMLPRDVLLDKPFQFLIKPWWRLKMDVVDGGFAEFGYGAFPFTVPERDIRETGALGSGTSDDAGNSEESTNPEHWRVTLGDQTHYASVGGVGPTGFTVASGSILTEAIIGALGRLNFSDFSGVDASSATASTTLAYTLREGGNRQFFNYFTNAVQSDALSDPTTSWLSVLSELHSQLGYSPPGFDLDADRYVARPAPQYQSVEGAPVISYAPGPASLLLPGVKVTPNQSGYGNRARVDQRTPGGISDVAVVDLNDLIPGHPLSQGVCGQYMELAATSPGGSSYPQLLAQAQELLMTAVRNYETVTYDSLLDPRHEAWETVAMWLPGDPIFDTPQLCAEASFSVDLFAARMRHSVRRLGLPATRQ